MAARALFKTTKSIIIIVNVYVYGWLGSRVVSVLDSGAEGPG